MKNVGKKFEEDFAKSVPDYCYVDRLKDTAQSYNKSNKTKFTWNNKCDFYLWDKIGRNFYGIECKSTKNKSMSVQLSKEEDDKKMIKYHQIKSLREMSKYDIVAGFFLNFRHFEDDEDKSKYIETTYFLHINDFDIMMGELGKKSFSELDLIRLGNPIKISGKKKRTRFCWDLDEFLKSQYN